MEILNTDNSKNYEKRNSHAWKHLLINTTESRMTSKCNMQLIYYVLRYHTHWTLYSNYTLFFTTQHTPSLSYANPNTNEIKVPKFWSRCDRIDQNAVTFISYHELVGVISFNHVICDILCTITVIIGCHTQPK